MSIRDYTVIRSSIEGSSIVVTGAAGFIGSSICDQLLQLGAIVTGIDCFVDYYPREIKEKNLAAARKNKNFTFIESDINALELSTVFKGASYIFHQAAQAGVRASWGELFSSYTHHNILATQKILEAAKNSPTIKRIVYASSSSVYGDAETYPTSELIIPAPKSPYGVTKLAAEHLMVLYATEFNVPTTSLRYFTVYGPRQRPDMAFNRFIRAALQNDALTLYGTGEQIRDFTFIEDIVFANISAAVSGNDTDRGSVYNLGGGTQASINEVLEIVQRCTGKSLKINRFERQSGDAFRTCADTTKAKKELGFNATVTLADGIAAEVEWLRAQIA